MGVSATNYCAINPNLEDRPQPTAPRPTSSKAPPTPMPTPQKPKPTPLPFVDDNNEDNQVPQLREKNNGRECSIGEPCGQCFGVSHGGLFGYTSMLVLRNSQSCFPHFSRRIATLTSKFCKRYYSLRVKSATDESYPRATTSQRMRRNPAMLLPLGI